MSDLSKRSTVYFDPSVHQALRLKAATLHTSVSELVDEAVRLLMRDDQEDLAALADRISELAGLGALNVSRHAKRLRGGHVGGP